MSLFLSFLLYKNVSIFALQCNYFKHMFIHSFESHCWHYRVEFDSWVGPILEHILLWTTSCKEKQKIYKVLFKQKTEREQLLSMKFPKFPFQYKIKTWEK